MSEIKKLCGFLPKTIDQIYPQTYDICCTRVGLTHPMDFTSNSNFTEEKSFASTKNVKKNIPVTLFLETIPGLIIVLCLIISETFCLCAVHFFRIPNKINRP